MEIHFRCLYKKAGDIIVINNFFNAVTKNQQCNTYTSSKMWVTADTDEIFEENWKRLGLDSLLKMV